MASYDLQVDGVSRGEVYRRAGRWYWQRGRIATEPYSRLSIIRPHVAQIFRTKIEHVKLVKRKES